jgi:hypothetical protein
MKIASALFLILFISSCNHSFTLSKKKYAENASFITGTEFYKLTNTYNWKQRDSFALTQLLQRKFPDFFSRFVPINSTIINANGEKINATFYVSQDYVCIGTNEDWARVPLTPMAAQLIADSFNCFLPTPKLVDLIYSQAKVKLEPQPMFIYRDSSITMWQHHLIIEGQRKNRKGLIAGIKKDVVLTPKLLEPKNGNKVAIYGWHKLNGKPIQPVYAGHINWYVDYSHGIRLVYRKVKVNKQWMDYQQIMKDPLLKQLICDEEACGFLKY